MSPSCLDGHGGAPHPSRCTGAHGHKRSLARWRGGGVMRTVRLASPTLFFATARRASSAGKITAPFIAKRRHTRVRARSRPCWRPEPIAPVRGQPHGMMPRTDPQTRRESHAQAVSREMCGTHAFRRCTCNVPQLVKFVDKAIWYRTEERSYPRSHMGGGTHGALGRGGHGTIWCEAAATVRASRSRAVTQASTASGTMLRVHWQSRTPRSVATLP